MSFNFSNSYPSTRLSLFARNAVSTSHPLGDNPKIQDFVAASDARYDG